MKHNFDFQKRFKNKKYLSKLFLSSMAVGTAVISAFGTVTTYAATVAELSPVTVLAIRDSSIPEPPEKEGYASVNLNIREQPDSNAKVIGKYKKGDKVDIVGQVSDNKDWVETDKGYVWGGYLSSSFNHDLNVHSDSEYASKYVGYAYHVLDQMDEKWLNYLKNYEIILCENPTLSLKGEAKTENGSLANGLTHYVKSGNYYERRIYLRSSTGSIPNTIFHELGHVIDFENYDDVALLSDANEVKQSMDSEKDALKEKYNILDGNISNTEEYFAETFMLSVQDPAGLKETAPIIADYMEQVKNKYC